jgi:transcriptional regulator with XRE-family HTH domain
MKLKKMPKLGDRLIYIRKMYDLSQEELAKKAGTTQQAIQQAETGKARQPRYLHKLAHALDISVEWMVFGDEDKAFKKRGPKSKRGFEEKQSELIDNFFSMSPKDQKLIMELMKSRQDK